MTPPNVYLRHTLALLLAACGLHANTPTTERACALACDHLRALGCESGLPTPGGTACEELCLEVEALYSAGKADSLHPQCVPLADTCAEADAVSMYGCE